MIKQIELIECLEFVFVERIEGVVVETAILVEAKSVASVGEFAFLQLNACEPLLSLLDILIFLFNEIDHVF